MSNPRQLRRALTRFLLFTTMSALGCKDGDAPREVFVTLLPFNQERSEEGKLGRAFRWEMYRALLTSSSIAVRLVDPPDSYQKDFWLPGTLGTMTRTAPWAVTESGFIVSGSVRRIGQGSRLRVDIWRADEATSVRHEFEIREGALDSLRVEFVSAVLETLGDPSADSIATFGASILPKSTADFLSINGVGCIDMVWAMSSPQTRAAQAACEDEALALRVAGQPDDWRAWAERARWHATGSWVTADSALAFASRAYRLAPGDAYVRSMLATALLRAGPTSGGSALAEPLTMGVVESATIDRPHGTRGWALLALAGDPRLLEHWPAANGRRTASPLLLTHCLDLLAAAGEEQSPGVRALLGLPLRAGQPSDATAAALVTSSWPEHLVESAEAQVAASRARSGAGSPLPLWLGPAILASGRFELLPDSFNIRDPAAGTYYGRLLETDVAAAFALSPHSTEAQRDQARRWLSARAELLEDVYSIVLPLRLPEFPAVELGAIQSFLGQREAAFATLYRARSRGYGNVAHLRNHVMFDSIRGDARFGRLVETMEEQRSDMRDRFLDYSEHPSIAGAERLVAGCDAVRTANLESIDRLVGSVLGVTR